MDCRISGNTAGRFGGGVHLHNSSSIVEDCTITRNLAEEEGGGMYAYDASPTLRNCIVSGNSTVAHRGAIYCWNSPLRLINCTISGNTAANGILFCEGGSDLTLTNCITWGNSGASIWASADSFAAVSYSCIEAGALWPGEGNLNEDPLFEHPEDLHLQAGSPCIDTGTPEGAPDRDIEGTRRPCGPGVDMGAYEYGNCPPAVPFTRGNANADDNTDLSDAVFVLTYLFLGGTAPSCEDGADADDNGALEITDAVYLLNYLFLGGLPPEPPFPTCGPDPTPDELGCEARGPCPDS
jgi:parallel beta-helix repeat protein